MSDTTSIFELPTTTTATTDTQSSIQPPSLDPTTLNQLINGIHKLGSTEATSLPSRDIPQTTQSWVQDPQVQPNYIPSNTNHNQDYIQQYESNQELIQEAHKKEMTQTHLDSLYDEFQIPLLIAILYFLFQMPFFKKALYKYVPTLFFADGNLNLYGYFFTSALFGIVFFGLHRIVQWV